MQEELQKDTMSNSRTPAEIIREIFVHFSTENGYADDIFVRDISLNDNTNNVWITLKDVLINNQIYYWDNEIKHASVNETSLLHLCDFTKNPGPLEDLILELGVVEYEGFSVNIDDHDEIQHVYSFDDGVNEKQYVALKGTRDSYGDLVPYDEINEFIRDVKKKVKRVTYYN